MKTISSSISLSFLHTHIMRFRPCGKRTMVITLVISTIGLAQNDGLVKTYYPSGAFGNRGNYTNGVRDGVWMFWYDGEVFQDYGEDGEPNTAGDEGENNGRGIQQETVVVDLNGNTFFDPPKKTNGGIIQTERSRWHVDELVFEWNEKDELNYSSGKLDGAVSRWYENGNKSEEGIYKLGKQEGSWTWYFDTGIKKERTTFVDGQQDGMWKQWFPDGEKNQNVHFPMEKETVCGLLGSKTAIKNYRQPTKRKIEWRVDFLVPKEV